MNRIVEQLQAASAQGGPHQLLMRNAAAEILRLQRELNAARDDASRQRYPDTTGQ